MNREIKIGDPYMWDDERWEVRSLHSSGTIGLKDPRNKNMRGSGVGRDVTVWSVLEEAWVHRVTLVDVAPQDPAELPGQGGHIAVRHVNCPEPQCPYCAGLFACLACGGMEDYLPTECPGQKMGFSHFWDLQRGFTDFRDGQWRPGEKSRN